MFKKLIGLTITLVCVMAIGTPWAMATDYPARDIRVTIPYGAGGGTDTQARIFLNTVEKHLGKPMVVMNKPGAGGEIGNKAIARAKADGYNLGVLAYSDSAIRTAYKQTKYANDDFRYIATFTKSPVVLIVKKDSSYKTIKNMVTFAKKNPGKITVAMCGDTHNLTTVLFEQKAGIKLTPVFYKSGSKALNALMGGHVDAAMIAVQFGVVAKAQGLTVVAAAGDKRLESLPETPTFLEEGYDIKVMQSRILVAPKGTPDAIVEILKVACDKAARNTELITKMTNLGEVFTYMSGQELETYIKDTNAALMPFVSANAEKFMRKRK